MKAFKGQIQESFAPIALPKVVNAITNNVEVAQGGGVDVDGRTVLSYALFAYGLPRGPRVPDADRGARGLRRSDDRLREHHAGAIDDVHASRTSSRREKATAVALGEKVKTRSAGSERDDDHRAERERRLGLGVDCRLPARPALATRCSRRRTGCRRTRRRFDYFRTKVYFDRVAARRAGGRHRRSRTSSPRPSSKPLPRQISQLANGAMLTVVVGQTFHGSLASAPIDQTPKRERPNVVYGPNACDRRAARAPRRASRSRSWSRRSSSAARGRTRRCRRGMYWIDPGEKHKAVRLVYRMGSNEYWGVADDRLGRRARARRQEPHAPHRRPHRTTSTTTARSCTWSCCNTPKASYWVVNTLLDRLSNETMLAIAKGLKPLGSVKRRST